MAIVLTNENLLKQHFAPANKALSIPVIDLATAITDGLAKVPYITNSVMLIKNTNATEAPLTVSYESRVQGTGAKVEVSVTLAQDEIMAIPPLNQYFPLGGYVELTLAGTATDAELYYLAFNEAI